MMWQVGLHCSQAMNCLCCGLCSAGMWHCITGYLVADVLGYVVVLSSRVKKSKNS